MTDLQIIIEILQGIFVNPWMLLFVSVWVFGYMFKEYTTISDSLVPWFVLFIAALLSFILIENTVQAILIGVIIGYIQIGMYEHIKESLKFLKVKHCK